jgi:hypothetical protein
VSLDDVKVPFVVVVVVVGYLGIAENCDHNIDPCRVARFTDWAIVYLIRFFITKLAKNFGYLPTNKVTFMYKF